jgi:hypothetical protein
MNMRKLSAGPVSEVGAGRADAWRQVAVAVSAVVGVVVAVLGSGAVVGTPIAEVADGALATDSTLVAPAGAAFVIWSVIYVGLLALAVFQLAPSRRDDPRQRAVGWWVAASLLLNAAWVLVIQAELIALSILVIVGLLVVLGVVLVRLTLSRPSSTLEAVLLDGTTGLYLGWVCIATVANTASALVRGGVDAMGDTAIVMAVVVLIVAAIVGLALALATDGRLAPAIGLGWGLAWVAVERIAGEPESMTVAVAAALAAVVTIGSAVVLRVERARRDKEAGRSVAA